MTLDELNNGDATSVGAHLLRVCGSRRWSSEMLARRPFQDQRDLQRLARSVWWTLSAADWLEAFSAHPKIGERSSSAWSREEQSGVTGVDVMRRLEQGNRDYQNKFGWIFLVNATGKSGSEIASLLEARLQNEPADELRIAAAEQQQIIRLRLEKLLST